METHVSRLSDMIDRCVGDVVNITQTFGRFYRYGHVFVWASVTDVYYSEIIGNSSLHLFVFLCSLFRVPLLSKGLPCLLLIICRANEGQHFKKATRFSLYHLLGPPSPRCRHLSCRTHSTAASLLNHLLIRQTESCPNAKYNFSNLDKR